MIINNLGKCMCVRVCARSNNKKNDTTVNTKKSALPVKSRLTAAGIMKRSCFRFPKTHRTGKIRRSICI